MAGYCHWHHIIRLSRINSTSRAVAHTLADLFQEGNHCPSLQDLGSIVQLSINSVRDALARLTECGLLEIKRNAGRGLRSHRSCYAFRPEYAAWIEGSPPEVITPQAKRKRRRRSEASGSLFPEDPPTSAPSDVSTVASSAPSDVSTVASSPPGDVSTVASSAPSDVSTVDTTSPIASREPPVDARARSSCNLVLDDHQPVQKQLLPASIIASRPETSPTNGGSSSQQEEKVEKDWLYPRWMNPQDCDWARRTLSDGLSELGQNILYELEGQKRALEATGKQIGNWHAYLRKLIRCAQEGKFIIDAGIGVKQEHEKRLASAVHAEMALRASQANFETQVGPSAQTRAQGPMALKSFLERHKPKAG